MPATLTETESRLLAAVDRARRAPSVHNTQPWSFHLNDGGLELHSDPTRALSSIDPSGREMTMSCGAALLLLRVALESAGSEPSVTPFPDATRPHVVARVDIGAVGVADAEAAMLDRLADVRQTNRRGYTGTVTAAMSEVLQSAATREGADLQAVVRDEDRVAVMVWQQAAEAAQTADPAYRRELHTWVGDGRETDGIGLASTVEPSGAVHDLAPRDFALVSTGGMAEVRDDLRTAIFLLHTRTDTPSSWLIAGEALMRVWLEATRLGLVLQPLSQSVERPGTRLRLRQDLRLLDSWPQMLVRVGHASPQARTPRRSLDDVVIRDDRP